MLGCWGEEDAWPRRGGLHSAPLNRLPPAAVACPHPHPTPPPHSPLPPPPQALRYEAADDSRLAGFLVARARRSLTLASFLFWYLLTELADDAFGPRAAIVQVRGRGCRAAGRGRGVHV